MTHMEVLHYAVDAANRSKCRSKRGAVIWNRPITSHTGVKGPETVSLGYNYLPILVGDELCAGPCDGSDQCKATCSKRSIHAEQQAILGAERHRLEGASMLHIKTVDGLPVQGGPPSCLECSKLILASGIAWMWLFQVDVGWRCYAADEFHEETIKNVLGSGGSDVQPK